MLYSLHGDTEDHINTGPRCLISGMQLPALPPGRAETRFPHAEPFLSTDGKFCHYGRCLHLLFIQKVIAFAFDELDRHSPLLSLEG